MKNKSNKVVYHYNNKNNQKQNLYDNEFASEYDDVEDRQLELQKRQTRQIRKNVSLSKKTSSKGKTAK